MIRRERGGGGSILGSTNMARVPTIWMKTMATTQTRQMRATVSVSLVMIDCYRMACFTNKGKASDLFGERRPWCFGSEGSEAKMGDQAIEKLGRLVDTTPTRR